MRYAYDKFTTRVVSCKSNIQLAYDCRVRHEECRGLLKHVLKPYDNRSDRQFYIEEILIVYDFSMTRAARAIKIVCDDRKQKSYRVNRPCKLELAGHTHRDKTSPAHFTVTWEPAHGESSRGRPPTSFVDTLLRDTGLDDIAQLKQCMSDRVVWRNLSRGQTH